MIDLPNKLKYKISINLIILIGLLALILLFYINYSAIVLSLFFIEGMWILTAFILFRISITAIMGLIAFKCLFKQEKIHFVDISFLFGIFFLGLTIGKALDLLYKLIFFTSDDLNKLNILKIRYILIILTSAPLIFIGINLILFSNKKEYKDIKDHKNEIIISLILLLIIVFIQSIIVFIAEDVLQLQRFLLFIHIPSLIWIIFSFLYAKKTQKLPQINSLTLALVFLIDLILYVGSTLIISNGQSNSNFSIIYLIFAETIDLLVIIIIFFGFYGKINKEF